MIGNCHFFEYYGRKLVRMFHELALGDREDGRASGQSQGVGREAYLKSTSQGPIPEDAREDGHIRGRSRRFMEYPDYNSGRSAVWIAHLPWEQGVGGSNPPVPTRIYARAGLGLTLPLCFLDPN
jgi:hypothetical protein